MRSMRFLSRAGCTPPSFSFTAAVATPTLCFPWPNNTHKTATCGWGPNLNHMQLPAGPSMQRLYFDHYLKGVGPSFAGVSVSGIEPQNDGTRKITIVIGAPGSSIASAQLYYSEKGPSWETRTW